MKKLIEQLQAGVKGAAEVLLDFLLEQGIERETALCFINTVAFGGPANAPTYGRESRYPAEIIHQHRFQPWTYFDTVMAVGAGGERFDFFRNLPGAQFENHPQGMVKTGAHSNMVQPKRIPSYDRFRCTRISMDGPQLPEDAEIYIHINRLPLLDMSVNALLARGIWGVPVLYDISDRDDLNAHVRLSQALLRPFRMRLSLHGWRERPLGA